MAAPRRPAAKLSPLGRFARIFLPFAAGYYLSYLLRTVNAVIAPELSRELGFSAAELGLLTSAYFLAFGAFQIPLGVLLDRFGPRRVEATLLVACAAGAVVFATGSGLLQLAVGRAMIGFGVSACLMAALKSFGQWFPADRQPSLVGAIMIAGALGALSASLPLEWALPTIGWRGLFFALALMAIAAAAAIMTVADSAHGIALEPLAQQLAGVAEVFSSRAFWRYAPQSALVTGGFLALQGLWAVPWLMTVNGYDRATAAQHLFFLNLALMAGFFVIAAGSTWLAHRGLRPAGLLPAGSLLAVATVALIAADAGPTPVLWALYGFAVSTGNLAYPLVSTAFPAHRAGRVSTALNLLVFVGAFSIQWGFGLALDALQAAGLTPAMSFRASLAALLAAQAAAVLWYLRDSRAARAP